MAEKEPVIVVGGGWAGLAAACALAGAGRPAALLESAPTLGGRARSVALGGHPLDNGQHLLIGAYRDTLALMARIGADPAALLQRAPLELTQWEAEGPGLRLRAPRLPAPLHLAAALLTAGGLSLMDRLRATAIQPALRSRAEPEGDARTWLLAHRQPETLIRALWEPLCVAALNTPLAHASAALFKRTLAESFAPPATNADLLIPRAPLGELLPEPARRFIEAHGGRVETGRKVTALEVEGGRIGGVRIGDERRPADRVILAVAPDAARRLLAPHLPEAAERIGRLGQQPICTVYLEYPEKVEAPPMSGLLGTTAQWLFDRRLTGQPGVMAVVVSAEGPHMAMDNRWLADAVSAELARRFPHWPAPRRHWVIREKRATFAATPASEARRPAAATGIGGLWLAGDFTATGLPATLEGAVRSGLQCASSVLES